jgi:RND family efflux transporter MFP subunit
MEGKIRAWKLCLPACVLALAVLAGCRGGDGEVPVKRPQVTGVTITAVAPVEVQDAFEAAGTVRSDRTSVIASRVMGAVEDIRVREGDRVEPGQLLMTIDDRDPSERSKAASMAMEGAKQNRDLARATWKRHRSLYEHNALSGQEMDQVETGLKVAEAEYARAQAMASEARVYLGFTRITAPFSGFVTEKKIDAGSMASPGMPLLTIESDEAMYVETAVDESLTGKVKAGLPAEVRVDSLQKTLKGTVREVVPAVNPGSRTFIVKISVEATGLRSGLFTRVRIPLTRRTALLIPEASVVTKGQLTGVYAVDAKGVVTYRLVRTGKVFANGIEVLSGLEPGERIITAGVEKASDGGVITVETGT